MQIQRIQTLFLLCAVALLAAFIFTPFGYSEVITGGSADDILTETAGWYPKAYTGLWLPAALAAVIAFVSIFLFNRLKTQVLAVRISMAMTVVTVGAVCYFLTAGADIITPEGTSTGIRCGWGCALLVVAFVIEWMAVRRIQADARLLRDMDRVR